MAGGGSRAKSGVMHLKYFEVQRVGIGNVMGFEKNIRSLDWGTCFEHEFVRNSIEPPVVNIDH